MVNPLNEIDKDKLNQNSIDLTGKLFFFRLCHLSCLNNPK